MGLKNSRPLPLASAELEMAPFFRRRFRTWHLDHVALVVERYRALTTRHCIDGIQLSAILGIKEQPLIDMVMRLFMPKTPTRAHHMIDAMEIVIALILVCQAPSMRHRFEAIFDVIDLNKLGVITPSDVVVLFGAFARTVMKLFCYAVEPDQRASMAYIRKTLENGFADCGSIEKTALCKLMLTDHYAVHYTKQCTGEAKHKLYFLLEKDAEFLGAIEFHTEEQMKTASLKTIREMANAHLYRVPRDFTFLCQGREVKRVWEADRKGWSIVPFAIRGSPGVRVFAQTRNRHAECPHHSNTFEFRYMGNSIARYKKRVGEINPVYKHRGFKVASINRGKPLKCFVRWHVAENWSGEWVYGQRDIVAPSKTLLQKRLRNSTTSAMERVSVKNHQGRLVSLSDKEDEFAAVDPEGRPSTSSSIVRAIRPDSIHKPEALRQYRLARENRENKVKLTARMIAMEALQQLDGVEEEPTDDKENESRQANRTASVNTLRGFENKKRTTVLIHVDDGTYRPSRLLQPASPEINERPMTADASSGAPFRMRVSVLQQKLELQPSSTLSNGSISLGPFMSSSNIVLKEEEVEVYPVIVIRPHGDTVEFPAVEGNEASIDEEHSAATIPARHPLRADSIYLSEYEFEVSASESNFELIYHHVYGTSTDLITLNRQDVLGRTLLHDAAEHGHSNLLELLLKERVLRNVGDIKGDTPLHHAARHARLKEVSALLREGAAPWQLNHEGKSALYCALEGAAKDMGQSALSHKRPPRHWSSSFAVISRDVQEKNFLATNDRYSRMRQVIDLLWDRCPVSALVKLDSYDRASCLSLERRVYGDLFQACRDGNLLRLQRLIDLDKRATAQYINEQLDVLGRTGLHEAAEQGHTAIVDLLLKLGADGYIVDQRQQLPLHIAAEKGYERIAKCLIHKFPGSLQAQDCVGKTALHLAAERKHTQVALLLIAAIKEMQDRDYTVNLQDMHGCTALHYASAQANLAVCRALVDVGAGVNISYFERAIPTGKKHLLGVFDKRMGAVTGSCFSAPQSETGNGHVRFELDSPVEMLLRSSKERTNEYQDRLEIVLLLVSAMMASLHALSERTKNYPPPLYHLAVEIAATNMAFAIDVCKALSRLKYEVNLLHPITSESALLQECKRVCQGRIRCVEGADASELALVRTLIQIGANVDLSSKRNGETPLACAAWYGHLAMLDLLLEAGAQCDYFPPQSFSPLQFAALGNHLACSKLLLSHEANVNVHAQSPKYDEGPLFFAIRSKSEAMVDLFLNRGADPCAVCTLQRGVTTAFGIQLVVEKKLSKRARTLSVERKPTLGPGKELIDSGAVTIASPLTFTLLIARSLSPFASQPESTGVARAQRRHEWESLKGIAMNIARQAIASKTPSGSAGSSLVTRNDVYLACLLGYWELAEVLLLQQVVLSNSPASENMNALHLAAAAGQSGVVTALVAAGMNVNCRLYQHGSHFGPLFFALTHGHTETAARLLVLGAKPLDVLPYSIRKNRVRLRVHESIPQRFKDTFFSSEGPSRRTESPTRGEYHPERVAINFVRHLEVCINAKVPLLHYASGMGYTGLVKLLVEAGMIISTPCSPMDEASSRSSVWRREWYADSAVHVAVLCGHLDVVRYFASLAQFNFPRYFFREGNRPKSLLVTACTTKRVDLLSYLLSSGAAADDGGGYNALDTGDEIQSALSCCASGHFVDGVMTLLKANARPDFFTLSMAVEGITLTAKRQLSSAADAYARMVETFPRQRFAARPRRDKRRILARTHELLHAISPFARNADQFFKVLSFDHVLSTFIICSQYGLWAVLDDVFLANETFFAEPLNPWKPIVVRAASCCMVMHRAAMSDQVDVLRFFVRLGVQADLRLPEIPTLSCPIRCAASHEALQSFLFLALNSKDLGDALDITRSLPPKIHYRSITSSTSWLSPSSTCKWRNLSAMSCYDVPQSRQRANIIQAFVHLWARELRKPAGNKLLHLACARGNPVLVKLLIAAGADLEVVNEAGETSLMVAAQRQDAFGVVIVRCLTAAMPRRSLDADEAARVVCMGRALVACFAQNTPCQLKVAEILLAAGADANFVDEISHPPGQSAMRYALQSVHFAGVQLLVDNGATFSVSLTEAFLSQFRVTSDNLKSHWRRFASYLKSHGQRLLDVENIMVLLLDTKHASRCLNEDLLHQMLIAAAAIAATTGMQSGHEKKFWGICAYILAHHAEALSNRKTVWGQKSALHYAVKCLEVGIVQQLVNACSFDIDAEDERKETPLHLVAMSGDTGICHLLLSKLGDKTRVDCVDTKGRTPLHIAVIHGNEQVVAQLLQAGASLRVRCARGYNAHLYAATLNHVAILMALFAKDSSRDLFYSASGEFALFLAARNAAFRAVRWIISVFQGTGPEPIASLYSLSCTQHLRTLLHYASIFGDEDLVKDILAVTPANHDAILNAKDAAGYTPLLYAFAFGRLGVATLLVNAGADTDVSVDHSSEAKTHPYACRFTIASLREWFALPGWFSFVATRMPPHKKRNLTTSHFQHEQYLFASGYHRRSVRAPVKNSGEFARQLPAIERNAVVRTTMRSWAFPKSSLLEFACEIGDESVIQLLTRLRLPGLTRQSSSFAVLRRAFLEAVQWNRIEIVDMLLTPKARYLTSSGSPSPTDIHFTDFLEVAIDRAISRGLEDMAIRLLAQWNGIKENGRTGADADAFAFQFAQAFQVACIRRLTRVVDYMISRGGEQIVSFHWNDGPSLVYAFAFGHTKLANVLLRHGAHISTIDTYVAPSFKKWIEYGCPNDVQVQWYELSAARMAVPASAAAFVGPLEVYEPVTDRLNADMMAALFVPAQVDAEEEDAKRV